jgi:YVTN family beta-propeller protein
MRQTAMHRRIASIVASLVIAGCSGTASPAAPSTVATLPSAVATVAPTAGPTLTPTVAPTPGVSARPSVGPSPGPTADPANIYWATAAGNLQPAFADVKPLVYVPDEGDGEIVVIDPATFQIVRRFKSGSSPEHVAPAWDGRRLYVNNMTANKLTVIDPRTGLPTGESIVTPSPYNLYFTPDGTRAIVVEDMLHGAPQDENGLRFYRGDLTGSALGFLPIPYAGADHLDFSADGKSLILSCEFSGWVVSVDVATMSIKRKLFVGGFPTDVRLAPNGRDVYVANQQRNGVDVIDADTLEYRQFIKLGKGAHGLALSRDASSLFVTNRLAGSLSVIDIATNRVAATWTIGGTPDMIAVSADGGQLWISNRYSGSVSVISRWTGDVLKVIKTGAGPHGLAFWPLPGRYSLGHNGNMR